MKLYGLVAGRHDLPVSGYVWDVVPDVFDFDAMFHVASRFVDEHCDLQYSEEYCHWIGGELHVVVTGLTACTAALIAVCSDKGVNLTLYHYDKDTGDYKPQPLDFNPEYTMHLQ